eukprot:s947_g7.t1
MSDIRRREATPQELAQGEDEMRRAQERMASETKERGEEPLEDVKGPGKEEGVREAKGSESVEAPKSEQKAVQDLGQTSQKVAGVSPPPQNPPSQPPAKSPAEFVRDQVVTPATKGHQVSPVPQDSSHAHQPPGAEMGSWVQQGLSGVGRNSAEASSRVDQPGFPSPVPQTTMQTPLFSEEQVAQMLRLHNQAPWLYGGPGMGFTPHIARPTFLPAEEEVNPQFRNRQYQDRIEAEEVRRNMEIVLEENRLLKDRLAQLESRVFEEPKFSTPESQKGRFEEPPKPKEAADPHRSKVLPNGDGGDPKEAADPQSGHRKEAADPQSGHRKEAADPQSGSRQKEDGPAGQQESKEAETTNPQRGFAATSSAEAPKTEREGPMGASEGSNVSEKFMLLMMESMKEMQKNFMATREEAGIVRGVEVVRTGAPELPSLPSWNPAQGPLQLGDWLLLLEPLVADMSASSELWWSLMTTEAAQWYQTHMSLSPLERINHQANPPAVVQQEKWQRLERRMSAMLLQAIPESIRDELVASRRLGVFGVLTHLYTVYSPGGVFEKQTLLKNLEEPQEVSSLAEAPAAIRRWLRWRRRTEEVGAVPPDPALLLKGINRLTRRVVEPNKELQFRISLVRSSLGVDSTPTAVNVGQLATHLLAELEQAALMEKRFTTGNAKTENVKIKQFDVEKSDKEKGKGKGSEKTSEETGGKQRCKFYLTDTGCRKGKQCSYSHEARDERRRCWTCGATDHMSSSCSRPKASGSGSDGSPQKPKQMKVEADEKSEKKDSDTASVSSQESVMQNLMDEANKVLRSLNPGASSSTPSSTGMSSKEVEVRSEVMDRLQQQLDAMKLKTFRLQSISTNSVLGLIDSGATHPLRPLREGENDSHYAEVEVALANGSTTRMKMSPGGAMISPNSRVEPIVPMGLLAEELQCTIEWKDGNFQVLHPHRGSLPVVSSERCPQIPRQLALELIREMEDKRMGIPREAKDFEAEVTWMKSLVESHPILSSLPTWLKKRLVVQPGEWSDLPANRRLRRTMRREGYAVHMFAGKSEGFTLGRALQQLGAKDGWLLELDIHRGEQHDLLKDKGAYSGLLRSALEGKLRAIVGGPNCRSRSILRHRPIEGRPDAPRPIRQWGGGEFGKAGLTEVEEKIIEEDDVLLWRMVFLYMISHYVAKARGIDQRVHFSLEQPASPKQYNKDVVSFWDTKEWAGLKKEFGFKEETFEQGRLGGPAVKPTTFGGTLELDVEGHQMRKGRNVGRITDSKQLARWAPGVMSMVASALVQQVYNKTPKLRELSWAEHIAFGHIPHRRDCRVCQESQQISDQHRKIQYPLGATLSIDVAGPLKKAYDKGGGQARYMLVGAMTWRFLKGLQKLRQPPDEALEDDAPEIEVQAAEDVEGAGEALGEGDPRVPPAGRASDAGSDGGDLVQLLAGQDARGLDRVGDAESDGGDLAQLPAGQDGDAESGGGDLVQLPSEARGHEEEEQQPGPAEDGPDIEETELKVFRLGLPMVTKTAREVAKTTMEFVLRLKADGYFVNRIHTDQGHEFGSHFRRWALERGIMVTRTPGDDPRGNGRAECAVKAIKCQVRKALRQANVGAEWWPWALRHVGELNRLVRIDKSPDFPRFLQEVRVRKRSWRKASMEMGVEKMLYLCPAPEEHGHWVVKEGDPPRLTKSILRTTTEPEDENQWLALERDLLDAWTVRRRLRDKTTVRKLEGREEPEELEKEEVQQQNQRIVKLIEDEMKLMVDDDPECVVDEMVVIGALRKMVEVPKEHEEVLQTKIISPQEVARQWEQWLQAIDAEVCSLVEEKEALRMLSSEEVEELKQQAKKRGQKIECIPSKMVYTLKPAPGVGGGRKKARLVACGNFEEKKKDESTYSSGADAAAFRIMIWVASREGWKACTLDVKTAFLNADMTTQEDDGLILIKPPSIFLEKGYVPRGVMYQPLKAVYGFRRSPRLWSLLRDQTMRDFKIQVTENGQSCTLVLVQLDSEPNLWKIALDMAEDVPTMSNGLMRGLVMSYVDDLFITGPDYVVEAVKAKFESTWATSKPEYVTEEAVRFLGMEVKKEKKVGGEGEVWYVTQESYISDLLSKEHSLKEKKIPISRDQSLMEPTTSAPTPDQVKQCQKEVGEALWLVTRTRPDIMYAVSRMGSNITKAAEAVLEVSKQLKGYLLKTKGEGLRYEDDAQKAIVAMGAGEAISVIVDEIYEEVEKVAWSDSQAAVAIMTSEGGSWRTRHLRMKAAYARQTIAQGLWGLSHMPGEKLIADAGTKAVSANRLEVLKKLMGMGKSMKKNEEVDQPAGEALGRGDPRVPPADRVGDAGSDRGDLVQLPTGRDGDAESGGGDLVQLPSIARGPKEDPQKNIEMAANAIRLVVLLTTLTKVKGQEEEEDEEEERDSMKELKMMILGYTIAVILVTMLIQWLWNQWKKEKPSTQQEERAIERDEEVQRPKHLPQPEAASSSSAGPSKFAQSSGRASDGGVGLGGGDLVRLPSKDPKSPEGRVIPSGDAGSGAEHLVQLPLEGPQGTGPSQPAVVAREPSSSDSSLTSSSSAASSTDAATGGGPVTEEAIVNALASIQEEEDQLRDQWRNQEIPREQDDQTEENSLGFDVFTTRWGGLCYSRGYRFDPLNMDGQGRTVETSATKCQQRCAGVQGCAHFAWWSNGGCHLQNSSATYVYDRWVYSGGPSCEEAFSDQVFGFVEADAKQMPRKGFKDVDLSGKKKNLERGALVS